MAVIQHDVDTPLGYLGLALREAGATIRLHRPGFMPSLEEDEIDGVVILGGQAHPKGGEGYEWQEGERELVLASDSAGLPVLGICLGAQLIAQAHGGTAVEADQSEIGWCAIEPLPTVENDPLLAGAPWPEKVFQWHYWRVETPPEAVVLALNDVCVQAFRASSLAWGLQFHFEADPSIAAAWVSQERAEARARASGDGSPDPEAEYVDRYGLADHEMLRDEVRFARQREFAWHVGTRFVEIVQDQMTNTDQGGNRSDVRP